MDTPHQMEFAEVVPFPYSGAVPRVKRRRRGGCPCQCLRENAELLRYALALLSDERAWLVAERLRGLRRSARISSGESWAGS